MCLGCKCAVNGYFKNKLVLCVLKSSVLDGNVHLKVPFDCLINIEIEKISTGWVACYQCIVKSIHKLKRIDTTWHDIEKVAKFVYKYIGFATP